MWQLHEKSLLFNDDISAIWAKPINQIDKLIEWYLTVYKY